MTVWLEPSMGMWVWEMNGWYDHVPEIVLSENDDYEHLWDFSIPQDHEIEAKTRVGDH